MSSDDVPARLKKLTDDQLLHVKNWLLRGGEVMALTRHIQQEWKIATDVNERTFCMQLNRYKKSLFQQTGAGSALTNEHGALIVKATRTRDIDPMERLVALVDIQEKRIQMFLNKEAQVQMPIAGVEKVIDSTKALLLDIQKLRFELGLDQYNGPVQGGQVVRGAVKTVEAPDGTKTTSTLFEAVAMADQVLQRAGIPANLKLLGRDVDGADSQG